MPNRRLNVLHFLFRAHFCVGFILGGICSHFFKAWFIIHRRIFILHVKYLYILQIHVREFERTLQNTSKLTEKVRCARTISKAICTSKAISSLEITSSVLRSQHLSNYFHQRVEGMRIRLSQKPEFILVSNRFV